MTTNFNKHIWDGWTVQDYISELEPQIQVIMSGASWRKPFETVEELGKWCVENQPYYKKRIPEVVSYFKRKYHLSSQSQQERKFEYHEGFYAAGNGIPFDASWSAARQEGYQDGIQSLYGD
ncbi:MAG: hypothetical protein IJI14_17815 [Anaerolineaceae bacterium]|nr:hypothetical protein [Anaerolineaceae bacterium]